MAMFARRERRERRDKREGSAKGQFLTQSRNVGEAEKQPAADSDSNDTVRGKNKEH
jgi:hypothetical protein